MSADAGVFSIHDLVTEHNGEWLALEVVERDAEGLPRKARLLASANTRLDLNAKIKDQKSVYIKFAGPLAPNQYGFLY
ncbi:MAG TPA: hypothetical protein VFC23_10235 [Thermoanaerobaculia bacterium]|nr:hypothetical protein [Thermoanaerobaculia bacterium]